MKKKSEKPQAKNDSHSKDDLKIDDTQEAARTGSKMKVSEEAKQSAATSTPESAKSASDTTSAKQDKKSKPAAQGKSPKPKSGRPIFSFAFLLLFVIVTGLVVYDFWFLQKLVPVNAQLATTQQQLESRISQLERGLQQSQNQLSAEVQARQHAEAEHQALTSAMQRVTEKLGRSTIAWRMAEVEYLLTVANHRLTLAQDRQTAIAVFETADTRLEAMGDPSLLKVRKRIASELAALRSVADVDIPGLALQVGSLVELVEQLPLQDKKRIAAATQKPVENSTRGWRDVLAAVWQDLKSLVQVRRHEQPTEPLLPPNQAWFLYQNLQLKLEQARLAVLQHNTALFHQSLGEALDWVNNYFDAESAAVKNLQETINTLRTIELQPPLPDVSGSLRELRAVMHARANRLGDASAVSSKSSANKQTGSKTQKDPAKKSAEIVTKSIPVEQANDAKITTDAKGTATP